jgi:hypothetical protein
MVSSHRVLLGLVFMGILAGAGFQARALHLGFRKSVLLEKESEAWRQHVAALRNEAIGATAEQTPLPTGAPEVPLALAPSSDDAAFDAKLRILLERVSRLKARVAQDPTLQIPELRFLDDTAWFEVVQRHDLETEADFRAALSRLQDTAKSDFGSSLGGALKSYLKKSADRLPADVAQLAPYFVTPVDPALFRRYEMIASGQAVDVPRGRPVMGEKSEFVSSDAENLPYQFTINGGSVQERLNAWSAPLNDSSNRIVSEAEERANTLVVREAIRAFENAHPDGEPQNLQQLLPYFRTPADGAKFSEFKLYPSINP